MRRLALLIALLAGTLLVPAVANAARSEFFGVVQGQFDAEGQLDARDVKGMAAKGVHTNRFELGWKSVEPSPGTFDWGTSDRFIGALASRGIRAVPVRMGIAPLGGRATRGVLRSTAPAHKQRLGELPQGGGRPVRARRLLLEQRLPPAIRSARHPAADPLVAGVERAQSEEVLQPRGLRLPRPSTSTRACSGSPTTRSRAGIRTAQIVLAGNPGLSTDGGLKAWVFLDRLYGRPGSRTTSTSPPCTRTRRPSTTSGRRSNGSTP